MLRVSKGFSKKQCSFFIIVVPVSSDAVEPEIRPHFSGSHTFSLTTTASTNPDTNSLTFVLVTAERKVDFAVFLLFYGLIVAKFALICTMEIWLFIPSLDLLYLRN